MAEYVDSAVQTVLSSSRLKLAHPGNAKLTQVYPTPSETTSVLAQCINNRGQFRVAPNNIQFAARSDFILSSSALISEMAVYAEVSTVNGGAGGVRVKPNAIGWLFDVIDSIEITYSNSLMQNMFIRGEALKDYCLATCQTPRERVDMLKNAGQMIAFSDANGATNVWKGIVPICFLNHSPASLRSSWPVDGSVLAGPIQISVNWRTSLFGFVAAAAVNMGAAAPAAFSKLNLVCKTSQLQDASFSVKKAMMLDPQLVYSLPARYITSVDYSRAFAAVGGVYPEQTINLASAPSGMLEAIMVSIRPRTGAGRDQWVNPNANGTINVKQGSVTLESLRLEFGGQNLFKTESYEEMQHYQRSTFGDTLEWTGVYNVQQAAPDVLAGTGTSCLNHMVYLIPLVNDGNAVFREHTNENLPSYGGSQLQLYFTVSSKQRIKMGANAVDATGLGGNASSLEGANGSVSQDGADFQIWVTYIVSGLLEISQGTVDLQL